MIENWGHETSVPIQKNLWKIPLHLQGYGPTVVMVSLFDLLYKAEDEFRMTNTDSMSGLHLEHDVIVFNSDVYDTTTGAITLSTNVDVKRWWQYGFDIAPVRYDKRSPLQKISTGPGSTITEYLKGQPSAALFPSDVNYFHAQTPEDEKKPWYNLNVGENAGAGWKVLPLLFVGTMDRDSRIFSPLVLGEKDVGFQNMTGLTNPDDPSATVSKLTAYNTIALNPHVELTWKIVSYLVAIDKENWNKDDPFYGLSWATQSTNIQKLYTSEILKNTYVWLRCSFFGDYIQPDSFNQNLDQKSGPIMSKMSISDVDDGKKYDSAYAKVILENPLNPEATRSEKSQTYVPLTTPLIDLGSRVFIPNYTTEDTFPLIYDKLEQVKSKLEFPLPPISRSQAELDKPAEYLTPPGWYDPDTPFPEKLYDFSKETRPVLPPKSSISTGGRLFSISIDELWILIKKMVVGRVQDDPMAVDAYNGGAFDTGNTEYSNPISTTLPRVRTNKFFFKGIEKRGDVLDYVITPGNEAKCNITQFVTNPQKIKYYIFTELTNNFSELKDIDKAKPFLPSSDGGGSITELSPSFDSSSALWGLRPSPYSLRELELLIKTNKYNMMIIAKMIKFRSAATGLDSEGSGRGTLYQFHRDYSFTKLKINEPKKWPEVDENNVIKQTTPNITLGDTLEKVVSNAETLYGVAGDKLNNPFMLGDIYLSAEGVWRSRSEYIRFPVIEEDF